MNAPLMTPHAVPTISAHMIMTHGPWAWVASVVAHTEDNATRAPTDRSMPPPMMTNVIPTVTTPMTDALTRCCACCPRSGSCRSSPSR